MNNIVLYTALFGRHELLYDPFGHLDGTYRFDGSNDIDRFYFTDLDMSGKGISYPIIKKNLDDLLPARRIRKIMILIPPEIFDDYEYSLFVGCRPKLAADPYQLLDFLETDILLFSHGSRNCAYEEGKVCANNHKAKRATIERQLDFYRQQGFPSRYGLYNSVIMLRKHTKKMRQLMNSWWEQLEMFSHRDQISLPYVLWKHKFEVTRYPYDDGPGLWIDERSLDVGGK